MDGHDVIPLRDLRGVAQHLQLHSASLLVLGDTADENDAADVCRQVRERSNVPIAVISDSKDPLQELLAFASGADEYLHTEVPPRLLRARIQALLRRAGAATARSTPTTAYAVGPLHVDTEMRTAYVEDRPLKLTKTEFDLIAALTENRRRVIPRGELIERIWGHWPGDDHVLEVHLSRLRTKVRAAGGPRIGESVPGFGYRLGIEPARVG